MRFKKYNVIIVGAGAAGLYTAVKTDSNLKILVISKREYADCNTALAQGGIAATLDESDDIETHINDTLIAGNYKNNKKAVRILVENGRESIEELAKLGVDFDKNKDGSIALGLEGGHSLKRIAHHKDNTGFEIITKLIKKVKSLKNIDYIDNAFLLRLEKQDNTFFAQIEVNGMLSHMASDAVVLATGGIGQVYERTTNSAVSTGDGIQFAYSLGARIEGMNLIQFHPTAFAPPAKPLKKRDTSCKGCPDFPDCFEREQRKKLPQLSVFLISEAVRGEGAYILNKDRERFCDELKPRDKVSRCIFDESKRTNSNEFYLDISHKDSEVVKKRFPMIYSEILENGYDMTREPIPIFPCQHYLMGGISVNDKCQTDVDGLFAVGECSFTGVHGTNRLASNSLLEALVFGCRAAINANELCLSPTASTEYIESDIFLHSGIKQVDDGLCNEIRGIMQKAFFIYPDYGEVQKGLERIIEIKAALEEGDYDITPEFIETKSLTVCAYLILKDVAEAFA